jgi:transposase
MRSAHGMAGEGHCHRKFFDVWEATKSPVAMEALDRIAAVYAIEDKARFAPAAERVEHRRQTAPLLDAFFAWATLAQGSAKRSLVEWPEEGKTTVTKLSGKLELAKAFRYTIDRREALTRFVTDGRLEVDNNIAENAMRGIALGRIEQRR